MGWLDQDGIPDGKRGEGTLGELSDRGVEVVLDENPDDNAGVVKWVISFDRHSNCWSYALNPPMHLVWILRIPPPMQMMMSGLLQREI